MGNFIKAPSLTPAIKETIDTGITGLHTIIDPLVIELTPAQQAAMLKVGSARGSECVAIKSRRIDAYPSVLPASCTALALMAIMQEETDTASLIAKLMAVVGGLQTHLKIVQNDVMYVCSQSFDNAKNLGKTVPAVKVITNEISAEFHGKTSVKKVAIVYSLTPSGVAIIVGVETGKMFTNLGLTVLTILVVDGLESATITLSPSTGFEIPNKWTKIIVTNKSATSAGSFSVFMQA